MAGLVSVDAIGGHYIAEAVGHSSLDRGIWAGFPS
jgi:hypothetical protein